MEKATWHNIVVWGPLAKVCVDYLNKGDMVSIEGEIDNRTYDDKDGNKRYVSEIVMSDMEMLGGKKQVAEAAAAAPAAEAAPAVAPVAAPAAAPAQPAAPVEAAPVAAAPAQPAQQ